MTPIPRKPKPGTTLRNQGAQRILATVDSIPAGQVATYGQVALEAGLPGRARLVGKLMRELESSSSLPWQRVIGTGGRISRGPKTLAGRRQIAKLKAEGVEFRPTQTIDLKRFGWLG
ncbi:MAG: methylated-DNA-protein-cysteine methyltransferase-like protein [Candidatus Paceibacteria bacterium]|jgi:methylated-DNA-protein-cysteine methyltransferase-like protein